MGAKWGLEKQRWAVLTRRGRQTENFAATRCVACLVLWLGVGGVRRYRAVGTLRDQGVKANGERGGLLNSVSAADSDNALRDSSNVPFLQRLIESCYLPGYRSSTNFMVM